MVKHTLKILQEILQDFKSVIDHFGTLCIKGLRNFQSLIVLQEETKNSNDGNYCKTASKKPAKIKPKILFASATKIVKNAT